MVLNNSFLENKNLTSSWLLLSVTAEKKQEKSGMDFLMDQKKQSLPDLCDMCTSGLLVNKKKNFNTQAALAI